MYFIIAKYIGSVITVVNGWEDFSIFLNKKISITVSTIFIICIFILFSFLIIKYIFLEKRKVTYSTELETIEGKSFGVERVYIDGKRFVNCTFDGSELVFEGKSAFALEKNHFKVPPRIAFEANAGITANVMTTLYNTAEFKIYIEQLFQNTRR